MASMPIEGLCYCLDGYRKGKRVLFRLISGDGRLLLRTQGKNSHAFPRLEGAMWFRFLILLLNKEFS